MKPALKDEASHRRELKKILASLTEHEKDLLIDCPTKTCPAKMGQECTGQAPGIVHFGRRLARALKFLDVVRS